MKSKGEKRKKKPYRPPRLVAYGDFRTLTRATTKGGTGNDGGGKPQTRLGGPQSG
jgi:hypothetical protein